MMRILVTADPELPVPPPLYGGIERIVHLLVEALGRRGYTVGLVAHRQSTSSVSSFYPWPGLRSQRIPDTLSNMFALARAVRRFKPDVLHSFSRAMYLLPLLASSLPKIMSYQRHPGRRQVAIAAALGSHSLSFTACSEFVARNGRQYGGAWRAIHNFVDTDRFAFSPHVPPDAPLLFLSRVERLKGAHLAIAAARRAGRRLVIAGNHADTGPEEAYWREEILPEVDGEQVRYVGTVDDQRKSELLRSALALLVPVQWDEPFGIVFAEALACGTPVISTPRGALPEIVDDGVTGYLVADPDDLVRAITAVAQIDRRRCRARAEEAFSTDPIVTQYCALYEERVLARKDARYATL